MKEEPLHVKGLKRLTITMCGPYLDPDPNKNNIYEIIGNLITD